MQPYELLEREFANWIDVDPRCMVACSSGTAALHLALEALALPKGSQVLVPEFTMIACARAVTLAGLKPVFVDCKDDLTIDLDKVELTDQVYAIMPVHIYGRECDMVRLSYNQRHHDDWAELIVIEDCAEAHSIKPLPSSNACWSFYRNKIIAGEEGGMVKFESPWAADSARQLRSLGFNADHNFIHMPRGHNYRLSNVHADLIRTSLLAVEANIARRKLVEGWYSDLLPAGWLMPPRLVPWVYDVRIPDIDNERVVQELNKKGVAARVGFKPMSMQPEYLGHYKHLNAYRLSREVLYLPILPTMTQDDVEQIVGTLRRVAS